MTMTFDIPRLGQATYRQELSKALLSGDLTAADFVAVDLGGIASNRVAVAELTGLASLGAMLDGDYETAVRLGMMSDTVYPGNPSATMAHKCLEHILLRGTPLATIRELMADVLAELDAEHDAELEKL